MLFDLDGTLIDSVPDLHASLKLMLNDLNLPTVEEHDVRKWVGNGAMKLIGRALNRAMGAPVTRDQMQKALPLFNVHYQNNLDTHSRIFPGAVEVLTRLGERAIRCACITNKPRRFTEPLLERMSLSSLFDSLVCGDDLPVKKPHPKPLLHAVKALRMRVNDGCMVGDSISDMSAARQAGIRAIFITHGYHQGQHIEGQDITRIDSLAEIHDLIP